MQGIFIYKNSYVFYVYSILTLMILLYMILDLNNEKNSMSLHRYV